jgi:apolipoprotein N-acyltransferase
MVASAFPPFNLFFFSFIGIAILIHLISDSKGYKQLFLRTFTYAIFLQLVALSWIALSGLGKNADIFLFIGGLVLLPIHALFLIIPSFVYYFISGNIKIKRYVYLNLFFFPFIWVAFEYFHAIGELSFPWLTLGNAFTTRLDKIQYIDITGVYGVSFWVCVLAALIYYLYSILKVKHTDNKIKITSKKAIIIYAVIIIVYILPNIYSYVNNCERNFSNNIKNKKLKVGIIQPNIDPWAKWSAKLYEITNDYALQIREIGKTNSELDLIIMPETITPYYFLELYNDDLYRIIKNSVDSLNIPVFMGIPDFVRYGDSTIAPIDAKKYKSGERYDVFNSSVLLEPGKEKTIQQKYSKIRLVAGSERMPHQDKLVFLKDLVKWGVGISSYQIGRDSTIFNLGAKAKFNCGICYESIYPDFISSFVDKGSEFIVIITNDGWWGKLPGTYQHSQYSVLRAIENRRWLVRSANTGVSGIIDPYGNYITETQVNERKSFIGEIGLSGEKTFYTKYGDVFAQSCYFFSIFLIVLSLGKKLVGKLFRKEFDIDNKKSG